MKISKTLFFSVLVCLGLIMVINHGLITLASEQYTTLLARYASNDGVIACVDCVTSKVDQFVSFLMLAWLILYIVQQRLSSNRLSLTPFKDLTISIQVIGLSFGILFALWFFFKFLNLQPELYMEDHLLENLTAVFFFAATVLLVLKSFKPGTYNRWWLLLIAGLFFVIAMEEISWGQRIIGWKTPPSFSSFNYQNETNLHNVLNPIMTPIYVIGNFSIGLFLLFIKEIRALVARSPRFAWLLMLLPTSIYAQTGLIFFALSLHRFWFGDELTEQFISFYILVYAANIYLDTYLSPTNQSP